jgi:hypothetical protein
MDRSLKPHGFTRKGLDWVRVRGDMEETVNIQPSWLGGRTVNLLIKDLETEKLFVEVFAAKGATRMQAISERIGPLIDGRDRWWRDEAGGPENMAELTVSCGLPWFDKVRTLEEQASNWFGRHSLMRPGYYGPGIVALALTLYRMGEFEEAWAAVNKPVPRTAIATSVRDVACVRDWLRAKGIPPN